MRSKILKDGKQVMANLIAGKDTKINYIYVGYSNNTELEEAPDVTKDFLESFADTKGCGYVKMPVSNTLVDPVTNEITFVGLLTSKDIIGYCVTKKTKLVFSALSCYKDYDKFVFSSLFDASISFVKDALITINVKLNIGE